MFKKTLLKGETPMLIMELPPYKRPVLRIAAPSASVLPPPVGAISRALSPRSEASVSASWWGRGDQPRAANHASKAGGNRNEGTCVSAISHH